MPIVLVGDGDCDGNIMSMDGNHHLQIQYNSQLRTCRHVRGARWYHGYFRLPGTSIFSELQSMLCTGWSSVDHKIAYLIRVFIADVNVSLSLFLFFSLSNSVSE